jgi:GNAT superfamily N-acetyltransferase
MTDLLVKLYNLPDPGPHLAALSDKEILVRRAMASEQHRVVGWVQDLFGDGWAAECRVAFARMPLACMIAVFEGRIAGFACHDTTCLNFFGPIGIDPGFRHKGIGQALLLVTLNAMAHAGYAYAVVGGPVRWLFLKGAWERCPYPDRRRGSTGRQLNKGDAAATADFRYPRKLDMSFTWFVGSRYLRARQKQAFISLITFLATAGIAVGVMALIVVIAVMTGFESELQDRILGIESHVLVMRYGESVSDIDATVASIESIDGVQSAVPVCLHPGDAEEFPWGDGGRVESPRSLTAGPAHLRQQRTSPLPMRFRMPCLTNRMERPPA